jgi:hypothetical protein
MYCGEASTCTCKLASQSRERGFLLFTLIVSRLHNVVSFYSLSPFQYFLTAYFGGSRRENGGGSKYALYTEIHTKRQATQQGFPHSLLGDGNKRIEIVYGVEKIFCTGPTRAAKRNKNLLYLHDKSNKPTKERPLSFVLFESPFTSVSTVSRGHPSL